MEIFVVFLTHIVGIIVSAALRFSFELLSGNSGKCFETRVSTV